MEISEIVDRCKITTPGTERITELKGKKLPELVQYCPILPYKWRKQERQCNYQGLPVEINGQLHYKCIKPK